MTTDIQAPPATVADWLTAIFAAAGCPPDEARVIAEHLVDSDLSGHPSHGIVRCRRYLEWIETGRLNPVARMTELTRGPGLALLDGHYSFGQVLGHRFVDLAIDMAAESGAAVIGLRQAGHLGRIGAWSERLAAAGLVSVLFVTVAGSRIVAPFGAAAACMSTAPVAIGVPHGTDGADPFILDFATSRVAEGKVLVALNTGGALPADALVDEAGRDTADPRVLYGASADTATPDPRGGPGALQAMGEHKGSGLALACELLAGALIGSGTNAADRPFCNGMLGIVLDPQRFGDTDQIARDVGEFIAFVRAAAPRDPAVPVMIPGDPERARRQRYTAAGVPLPAGLVAALSEASVSLGVPVPPMFGG